MTTLILETATEKCCLILSNNDQVIDYLNVTSESLLQNLEKFIFNKKLEKIAVGVGPGSFTSIRIGVIIAKTMAFAKKLPLTGFSSLSIYEPPLPGSFCVVFNGFTKGFHLLGEGEEKHRTLDKQKSLIELEKVDFIVTPQVSVKNEFPELQHKFIVAGPSPRKAAMIVAKKEATPLTILY